MKKSYLLIILLIGMVVALAIGKAVLQNTFSTSGVFVSGIEQEINYYKTQNAILEEQFLTASSLATIIEKANREGFVSENNQIILGTQNSLARR
jgi:hypothetical protein